MAISMEGRGVRFRVRLSRTGSARGLSHLEQIQALRRVVGASGLPFLPDGKRGERPKLSFGPAIAVGYESHAEYFDLFLASDPGVSEILKRLSGSLQEGFRVLEIRRVPAFFPSLEASVNVVRYEIRGDFRDSSENSIGEFLRRDSIPIEKVKGGGSRIEIVDAKPLIREMSLAGPDRLSLVLRFGPKRTLKPESILREWLGPRAPAEVFVVRLALLAETRGGELLSL
jgi:radical SAM-linked protein